MGGGLSAVRHAGEPAVPRRRRARDPAAVPADEPDQPRVRRPFSFMLYSNEKGN